MRPPADIFLALRYLRPKRTFISVITVLSVLGPTLGVAVLIIVMSVMSGFDRDIRARILEMQAHLQIQPGFNLDGAPRVMEDPIPVMEALEAIGIKGAPIIETPILVQHDKRINIKFLRGVNPGLERDVTNLESGVKEGTFGIVEGQVLIGRELAYELGAGVGDKLLIHSPAKLTESVTWNDDGSIEIDEDADVFLPEEVEIAGIFSMGLYEYDATMVFMHIDQAAELTGLDWGMATSVHARVDDPFAMSEETEALKKRLGNRFRVISWQEANAQLFGALKVEKNLMMLVLSFIVVVAAFCISGTLLTVVIQKTRDIGVMRAVGMGRASISRVFVLQGAIIGAVGTACGTGSGLLIIHFRNEVADFLGMVMGVEVFPKELYHLTQIPAMVKLGDLSIIVSLAFVVCIGASLLPALYAAGIAPARALQDEG